MTASALLRFLLPAIGLLAFGETTSANEHWRLSTEQPAGNFITGVAADFARDIRHVSDGELQIEVVSNSELFKRDEVLDAVATGKVAMGEALLSALGGNDPLFQIDSLPFLAVDHTQARKLWEASRPELEKRLLAKGVRLLYAVPWPAQSLYSRKPLNTLADFQGMKLRTYNPQLSRMAQLLGATPTVLATDEVPAAFSNGRVDSMLSSSATGVDTQAWTFATYFYDIRAFIPKNALVVNEQAFEHLPAALRQQILDAAKNAELRGWELSWALTGYQVRILQRHGMNVSDNVPPEIDAALQKAGKILLEEWLHNTGAEGAAMITDYRAEKTSLPVK